jgi:hypothetical protein
MQFMPDISNIKWSLSFNITALFHFGVLICRVCRATKSGCPTYTLIQNAAELEFVEKEAIYENQP